MSLHNLLRTPALLSTSPLKVVPIGHRGAPLQYPENSLESFNRAVELGAWMVELDVRTTADGVLVVFHDETLERLTGKDGKVADAKTAELAKMKVEDYCRIPTLKEVLLRLRERCWVNIEVKAAKPEAVAKDIDETGMADQVLLSSFDWDFISAFAKLRPQIPVPLLADEAVADPVAALSQRGARAFLPRHDLVNEAMVKAVQSAGHALIPWTVDTPADIQKLVSWQVDGICSNDVETLVKLLA